MWQRFVFPVVVVIVGAGMFVSRQIDLGKGVMAKGEVVELAVEFMKGGPTKGTEIYRPRIRFQTREGKTFVLDYHRSATPAPLAVGDQVDVLYDPADPAKAQFKDAHFQLEWAIPLGVGLVWIAAEVFRVKRGLGPIW